MKSFTAAAATALFALAAQQVSAAPTISSPASLIQCQPAAITWSGAASGSIYISVVQGTDISSTPLEQFPTQSGTSGSYAWTVDIASGTTVTFVITDSTGSPNYSSEVTIGAGSSDSCLSASSSGSSSAAAASSSTTAAGSSSTKSSSAGSSASSSASSAAASSTSSTSGAMSLVGGAKGLFVGAAAAGVALFA